MSQQFKLIFGQLRDILKKQAEGFTVNRDTDEYYGLEAPTGPASVRAWGGKVKSPPCRLPGCKSARRT